ncbi:MAG: hypothetical protein L0207_04985 [Chlamydiae bacterium]|nr:hypothetical protein [Chlamydiota bacterium]
MSRTVSFHEAQYVQELAAVFQKFNPKTKAITLKNGALTTVSLNEVNYKSFLTLQDDENREISLKIMKLTEFSNETLDLIDQKTRSLLIEKINALILSWNPTIEIKKPYILNLVAAKESLKRKTK